jgi:hypothetical protein
MKQLSQLSYRRLAHKFQHSTLVHRKKRFTSFPPPAGMSLTKLPQGRNNSVMTSLFPPMESLVVTSRLGTGNSRSFFYGVSTSVWTTHLRNWIQLPSIWKGKNTHNHIDSPSDLRSSAVEADIPAQQRKYRIQSKDKLQIFQRY